MKKQPLYIPGLLLLLLIFGCAKEKVDVTNISQELQYGGEWQLPVGQGTFKLRDLINTDSSDFNFEGDSIFYMVRVDSIVDFRLNDFLDSESTLADLLNGFPPIGGDFTNPLPVDIPVLADTLLLIDSLSFAPEFDVIQGVDIDSLQLTDGAINFSFSSSYPTGVVLRYWSDSGIYIDNELLSGAINFSVAGDYNESISLAGAVMALHPSSGNTKLSFDINYAFYIDAKAGETIPADGTAGISISISDLNGFDFAYGYFGQFPIKQFDESDSISLDIPEESMETLNGLSGTLNIGNPRVKFLYRNSFGMDEVFNLGLKAEFPDGSVKSTNFDDLIFLKPHEVTVETYNDSANLNGKALNDILQFPLPENLSLTGQVSINPDGRVFEHNYVNYVAPESTLGLGIEFNFPLELGANLEFRDTLLMDSLLSTDTELDQYIAWAQLRYNFENGFPLGFNANAILYNTETEITYDTVPVNFEGENFLLPAPVDDFGVVSGRTSSSGVFQLTSEQVETLSNEADAFIIRVSVRTTETSDSGTPRDNVKIQPDNDLFFNMGLAVKFNYNGELSGDDEEDL